MAGKKTLSRGKRLFVLFCLSILFLSVLYVNIKKVHLGQEENNGETEEEDRIHYEANLFSENEKPENRTEETDSEQESLECEFFLGIYGDRIAVYSRHPTGEVTLEEVLPYLVKSVYYDELLKGIPFFSPDEKLLLLENLTS